MNRYPLLIYRRLSRQMGRRLSLLWLVMLAVGLADIFWQPFLGNAWFILWLLLPFVIGWWGYYAFMVRRAWVGADEKAIVLQLPMRQVRVSYGRIRTITSTRPNEQYSLKELNGREKAMIKPYFGQTCLALNLNSLPEKLNGRFLPRILFTPRDKGILLIVPDWMKLSREMDDARTRWREQKGLTAQATEDNRSLAAKILDL